MIAAKFSDPDDFAAELRLDGARIERGIVRVTPVTTPDSGHSHVTVEASAVVMGIEGRDDRLIQLVAYCGEMWQIESVDRPTQERTGRIVKKVHAVAQELGLEVRGGAWVQTSTE